MALIDVTDLFIDPDFTDPMLIIHRQSTVNSYGENTLVENQVFTWGCIQPASGKDLDRLPDSLKISDVKNFWVRGKIVSDGRNQYPDILVFQGQRYEVENVQDWNNYPTQADGWSMGLCVRERPSL